MQRHSLSGTKKLILTNQMNNIQSTSRLAYETIKPELGDRQRAVYEEIKKLQPCTNMEIGHSMYVSINNVTPRTNELVKMGYVHAWGKRECKITGRKAIAWQLTKETLF